MKLEIRRFFNELTLKLNDILSYNDIQNIFEVLKAKDSKNGELIEKTFISSIKNCSVIVNEWIGQNEAQFIKAKKLTAKKVLALNNLKNKLEVVIGEIKAKLSPFISYSETMARRRADLQEFAMKTEKEFFRNLLDEIEKLFDEKRERLYDKIEREFGIKERFLDSFIKPLEKGLKWAIERSRFEFIKDNKWHQTWLEKVIEAELGKEVLEKELKKIFKNVQDTFQKAWEKKALETPPDLEVTESLLESITIGKSILVPLNLDISTSFLTSGITASIAAVAGLTAGWHTLEYALASVFPPAAVVTALITAFVFLFSMKSAKIDRKEQVRRLVETYYGRVLTAFQKLKKVEKEEIISSKQEIKIKIEKFEYKSLYELVHDVSIKCVNTIMEKWEKEISGNLTADDYHKLIVEMSKYLAKLNEIIKLLENILKNFKGV